MLNEEKFKEIYDQYRESGLTVRDFCLNQRIGEAKFYYWQNKLRHNNNRSASGEFVPMVLTHPRQSNELSVVKNDESIVLPGQHSSDISCEIAYPNGTVVKLKGQLSAGLLCSLFHLDK